jgi:Adaptive response protein AidB N-terminal domain
VLAPSVLAWVADAERHLPYLKTWDAFGRRRDELVTSEGWRALQAMGIREGMVAIAYEKREGAWSRVHQFAK